MRFDEKFAFRLQSARATRGLSQQDLSKLSGIAQAQLSRYEAGTNKPRPQVLNKLAEALEVSPGWLCTGIDTTEHDIDVYTVSLNIPSSLYRELRSSATTNQRSLNDEILRRLDDTFHPDHSAPGTSYKFQEAVEAMMEQMTIEFSQNLHRAMKDLGYSVTSNHPEVPGEAPHPPKKT
ncbi:helix-turn-helix domain-containing protein [Chromobacterium haemolyticum]|uniref:helix-turn-helix domain-containing protein n=1 Tax=Chromobacterium haemolyticum TaxID=394935 RepID=UPI0013171493|nr:helix-turn-helix transcriptional regulator [Chromobacterium haemolyticum]BBH13356.1 hypothetical protein CH06BL_26040 [Chromobacterium haemolyticum]